MSVLLLMPKGREEALAKKALTQSGIRIEICQRLGQLDKRINDQTGAVLIAEEALVAEPISRFLSSLRAQPPWSDLPLLVVMRASKSDEAHRRLVDLFGPKANLMFVARPLRDFTLVSAVQAA